MGASTSSSRLSAGRPGKSPGKACFHGTITMTRGSSRLPVTVVVSNSLSRRMALGAADDPDARDYLGRPLTGLLWLLTGGLCFIGQIVDVFLQLEALNQILQSRLALCGRQLEQLRVQLQVVFYRQLAIQREGLRHIAHPLPGLQVARVDALAEQFSLAGAGRQQPGEHLHGGGFAAAVGTQEAENLTAVNFETDLVDGGELEAGKADDLPEQAFFLAGTLDQVRENAAKLAE